MNISNILLCSILCIILILLINTCFNNEFLTNNVSNNNIEISDSNLLIPTSDQVYNEYDSNRTSNELSHQETSISNINADTSIVNTGINTPIVYSKDELIDTTIRHIYPPSYIHKIIDTGSGDIESPPDMNNNVLSNLKSIE
jgi:hypothetical protein